MKHGPSPISAPHWTSSEIYFPGGAGGNAALQGGTTKGNYYIAARGDCAIPTAGSSTLPSGCALNSNGSIQEGTSANPVGEAANNAARNVYDIHEHAGLFGISAEPTDKLRITGDLMFGYNDNSFTRISPRQLQSYKIQVRYTPAPWANVSGAVDIDENRDNVATGQ